MNVLNATELFTLKWLILCHVNSISRNKTKHDVKDWFLVFLRLPKKSAAQGKLPRVKPPTMTGAPLPLAQLKELDLLNRYPNFSGIQEHPLGLEVKVRREQECSQ